MYQHLAHHYDELFPLDEQIKPFLEGFSRQSGNALDLGCGTGRITQLLDDFGMKVTGIDLDEKMIEIAKLRHPHVKFKLQNMMDAFVEHNYELITCFGNTLPHLDLPSLDLFFQSVSTHLSHKGVMIVQMLNYDLIMKNRPASLKTIEKPGIILERRYVYRKNDIVFETKLTVDQTTQVGINMIYPHSIETLTKIIKKHHMKPTFLSDDLQSPLKPDEPYFTLIIKNS